MCAKLVLEFYWHVHGDSNVLLVSLMKLKKNILFTLKASRILQGCSYHWRYLSDEWVHEKCPDQHNTEVIIKYDTLI